jgi:VWFA-related protein
MSQVIPHSFSRRFLHQPLRFLAAAFLISVFLSSHVRGSQDPKVALQVKAVSILASVRDKHGKVVANLTQDDFVVDEDGRPQTINYFAHGNTAPLRLGLLVDTSLSQSNLLDQERTASYSFLDHLLRAEKDLAFVIKFDREVELLRDFTADRGKLQSSLGLLETSEFRPSSASGGHSGGFGPGSGTLLYDAIFLAADELMSKREGRKALILLSDGVDRGSKETVDEAIERAQRSDTLIYSVLFSDEESFSEGHKNRGGPYGAPKRRDASRESPDGKSILEEIAEKTGGRFFEVSKKEPIEKIYSEIAEELSAQYSLGYTPDKGAEPGYHKIHIATRQKDLRVQARQGYYGGP